MARLAQRLPVGQVVPFATLGDRHDVVGVSFLVARADPPAVSARPCVTGQHSLTPASVGLVTIPTGCRIWPAGVVSLWAGRTQTRRPVGWEPLWHQDLNTTTPEVPVLLVVADTILR